MGGLLAADTLREFVNSSRDKDPLWPKIIACIGYDTPVGLLIFFSFGVMLHSIHDSTLVFIHLL